MAQRLASVAKDAIVKRAASRGRPMVDDPHVTFAAGGLERAAHLRGDAGALAALAARPDARVLPIWRGKPR